jgi:cyclic pyranopterin phosphate synthase
MSAIPNDRDRDLVSELSHLDARGHARMVDVGDKAPSVREAIAAGEILMRPETLALVQGGGMPKGDVLAVARVAGIMAAKRTPELVPLCHPLPITSVAIEFRFDPERADGLAGVLIGARVRCTGVTGVEMEALTAVSVAALTIYDMCKAVDRAMRITDIRLQRKTGGKSGDIILEEVAFDSVERAGTEQVNEQEQ